MARNVMDSFLGRSLWDFGMRNRDAYLKALREQQAVAENTRQRNAFLEGAKRGAKRGLKTVAGSMANQGLPFLGGQLTDIGFEVPWGEVPGKGVLPSLAKGVGRFAGGKLVEAQRAGNVYGRALLGPQGESLGTETLSAAGVLPQGGAATTTTQPAPIPRTAMPQSAASPAASGAPIGGYMAQAWHRMQNGELAPGAWAAGNVGSDFVPREGTLGRIEQMERARELEKQPSFIGGPGWGQGTYRGNTMSPLQKKFMLERGLLNDRVNTPMGFYEYGTSFKATPRGSADIRNQQANRAATLGLVQMRNAAQLERERMQNQLGVAERNAYGQIGSEAAKQQGALDVANAEGQMGIIKSIIESGAQVPPQIKQAYDLIGNNDVFMNLPKFLQDHTLRQISDYAGAKADLNNNQIPDNLEPVVAQVARLQQSADAIDQQKARDVIAKLGRMGIEEAAVKAAIKAMESKAK